MASLFSAHALSMMRRWEDVSQVLRSVSPAGFDEKHRSHFHHLLALASLWQDDAEEARRNLRALQGGEGSICLGLTIPELLASPEEPLGEGDHDGERGLVRRLRRLVEEGDALLAEGAPAAALRTLDDAAIWCCGEVQSLARLCLSYLAAEPQDDVGRFRMVIALASYRRAQAEVGDRRELPFLGHTLKTARLQELSQQCLDWLVAEFDRRAGRPKKPVRPEFATDSVGPGG